MTNLTHLILYVIGMICCGMFIIGYIYTAGSNRHKEPNKIPLASIILLVGGGVGMSVCVFLVNWLGYV